MPHPETITQLNLDDQTALVTRPDFLPDGSHKSIAYTYDALTGQLKTVTGDAATGAIALTLRTVPGVG